MMVTLSEFRLHEDITAALAAEESLPKILGAVVGAALHLAGGTGAWIATSQGRPGEEASELVVETAIGTTTTVLGRRVGTRSVAARPRPASRTATSFTVRRNDPAHPDLVAILQAVGGQELWVTPITAGPRLVGLLGVVRSSSMALDRQSSGLSLLADSASVAIQQAEMRLRMRQVRSPVAAPLPQAKAVYDAGRIDGAGNPPDGAADRRPAEPAPRPRSLHLSPREHQILGKLIDGLSCKEVAAQLGLSARTVEHHVERLKARFAQPRLHALVGFAVTHGLCTQPAPPVVSRRPRADPDAPMRDVG